jgi:WD40 repeat protein
METAKGKINAHIAAVPLRGHSAPVNCFGIYPEEPAKLASGSYDTMIKLWDIRDKNCTATLKGHKGHINSLAVSPDGNLLLSGA